MHATLNFARFRFEPASTRLWAGKREIKLTPKAARVLGVLIARAGEPVSKDELFGDVWRGTVVGDDALVTCIQELRKALGDDARKPKYIETRHRRGYRFVAPVDGAAAAAPAPARASAGVASIAVLPFTDMSPGRDQDYLCEGLAEELIDALTQIDGLRVAARSSSFRFRGAGLDVKHVGRELGDLFETQGEIATAVAGLLRGSALSTREKRAVRRPQTATDTYEYFLRGRQSLHRMTRPDLAHSREMFRAAIELDAEYAPAWAGLATAHAQQFEWWGSQPEDLREADRASRIAMELNPQLAEAHVARGFAMSLHRRYDLAEQHFAAASRINPQLYDAWYLWGRSAYARGQIERSAELFGKAAAARPDDFQSCHLHGQSLRNIGRLAEGLVVNQEAQRRAERILALNPRDVRTLSLGAGSLQVAGDFARAREWAEKALEIDPGDMGAIINGSLLYAKAGMKEEALGLLERALGLGWGKRDWIEQDPDYDSLRDDPRFVAMLSRLK